jgi:hypothetical protein
MIYAPGQFAYLHIPRTGGTSMSYALTTAFRNANILINRAHWPHALRKHTTARELAEVMPDWPSLYKFAVMRSPWEIVASTWRLHWRDIRAGKSAFNDAAYLARLERVKAQTFAQFVQEEYGPWLHPGGGFWRHFCLSLAGEDLGVECYRYEDLTPRWLELCGKLGCVMELPRLNAGVRDRVEWDAETIAFIADRCTDDIERFGFQPPSVGS